MKLHPLAELFPPMSAADYAALKDSLKVHGQLEPITVLDECVLDGRHRAQACDELGLRPKTVPFRDGDPLAYVLAKNLTRRHLDESQRGMIGARIATLSNGGNRKANQSANLHSDISLAAAAEKLSVARRTVADARKVLQDGTPELIQAVERGEIAVSAAKDIASLSARAQQEIALTKDDAVRKQKIKAAKGEARERRANEREAAEPKPLILTSKSASLRPAERSYSVQEWEQLSTKDRESIIAAGFECRATLNDQPGTAIEWARRSLNTVTGCLHDCPYCYARDAAQKFPHKFVPTFHPSRLSAPARQAVPTDARRDPAFRNIFANSMSDLFGQWVPREWILATIEMAQRNPAWNFLTLTKFPQRAAEFEFPSNWWMGTTVDAQSRVANAEKAFAKVRCGTKWLSVEPLLQPLEFTQLQLFQWLVIGGASASDKTPAWVPDLRWIARLITQADAAGVRIYVKTNCGMSDELRMREFPWTKPQPKELPKSFRYLKGL